MDGITGVFLMILGVVAIWFSGKIKKYQSRL